MTPRTKVVAFTRDCLGGRSAAGHGLCRLARDHGALSLVDGAQSFGVLDVDLSDMQPDFYTGSAHKWPCGPKENGLLFVSKRAHDRIKPSIVSLYPGEVGISRTLEGFGQRDEPAMMGFGEALAFQTKVGRDVVEKRSRELAQLLIKGLRRIDGVKVWTHEDPARSAAIVSFQPASLDVRKLHQALYEKDHVVGATRGGADRGGLRFSPHFYNLQADIERTVDAVGRYVAKGI
jgi:selenocysteine lyase/cysteine desulfurase